MICPTTGFEPLATSDGEPDCYFQFGEQSIDTDRRELRRAGELVAIEPQVFDLLVYLIRNRDRAASLPQSKMPMG